VETVASVGAAVVAQRAAQPSGLVKHATASVTSYCAINGGAIVAVGLVTVGPVEGVAHAIHSHPSPIDAHGCRTVIMAEAYPMQMWQALESEGCCDPIDLERRITPRGVLLRRVRRPACSPAGRATMCTTMAKRAGRSVKLSVSLDVRDVELLKRRAKVVSGGNVSAAIADMIRIAREWEGREALATWLGEKHEEPAPETMNAIREEWHGAPATTRRRKTR
jgi:hypothetical protein